MTTALLFPGQGAQHIGMGKDFAERYPHVARIFEEADEALGYQLSTICFEGPEETLKQTLNAQPAILLASLAAIEAARSEGLFASEEVAYVAGHSLGEYTALAAAGSLSVAEAVKLVRERGRAMQAAGEQRPGTMAAIIGLPLEAVQELCDRCDVEIANYNCPGQLVVSGDRDGVRQLMELARQAGARPVIELAVSAAFHSRLMEPAAAAMAPVLDDATIDDAAIPLVANVSATPVSAAAEIREELKAQVRNPVQWERSVRWLADAGVDRFVELGPGKALTGMVKRIVPEARLVNIGDLKSLDAARTATR